MTETDSFAVIVGDSDRARTTRHGRCFSSFARQLLALTRRQFESRLAHKVDLEVVQSAFKSFFVRHREGTLRRAAERDVGPAHPDHPANTPTASSTTAPPGAMSAGRRPFL
jgi:hypothetical protein